MYIIIIDSWFSKVISWVPSHIIENGHKTNSSFYLNGRGGFRYQNPPIILPGGVATPQTPPVPAPILSTHLPNYPPIYLSTFMTTYQPTCLYNYPITHLPTSYLPTHPYAYLHTYLPDYPPIYLQPT